MNVLFVCIANLQRSPTAEELLRKLAGDQVNVKSAGISSNAETRVDHDLVRWSDRIYVMTERIKGELKGQFSKKLEGKGVKVLGIQDRYLKGSPQLKKRLLEKFSRDDFLSGFLEGD